MAKKNIDPAQLLQELKAENQKASSLLLDIKEEMRETDAKYVQLLIQDDLNNLEAAKKIIERENK